MLQLEFYELFDLLYVVLVIIMFSFIDTNCSYIALYIYIVSIVIIYLLLNEEYQIESETCKHCGSQLDKPRLFLQPLTQYMWTLGIDSCKYLYICVFLCILLEIKLLLLHWSS